MVHGLRPAHVTVPMRNPVVDNEGPRPVPVGSDAEVRFDWNGQRKIHEQRPLPLVPHSNHIQMVQRDLGERVHIFSGLVWGSNSWERGDGDMMQVCKRSY